MGCVAVGIAVGVGGQGREVLLRSQSQRHLSQALTRRRLTSYIDLQIANTNSVLISRTLGGFNEQNLRRLWQNMHLGKQRRVIEHDGSA